MRKLFLSILIYTLVLGAIFGIVVILLGIWNELTTKVLAVTATIFGFSLPGLSCSSLYDKKNYENVASIGMIICFLSCLFLVFNILTEFNYFGENGYYLYRVILISVLLSCSFGHISALLMEKPKNKIILNVRDLTIVLSVFIDVIWIYRILVSNDDWLRLDAVLAILICLGTVVVPIGNKICSKNLDYDEEEPIEDSSDKPIEENTFDLKEEPKVEDKYDKLEKLKSLLDSNVITQEEFDSEKKKILEEE